MSYAHDNHYKWIESNYGACSDLGKQVANILGFVCRGIYNAPINYSKIEWGNPRYIKVHLKSNLSNFDNQKLTDLVLVCHYKMIRVTINPSNSQGLGLEFWQRHSREGCISKRLPRIETMIDGFKEAWGIEE